MKPVGSHNYFVYITTNKNKRVLYTSVTNSLRNRTSKHEENAINNDNKSFTGRYKCFYLIYWERFDNINDAIDREKQIKGWSRAKKEALINSFNPGWRFLNDEIED